MKTKTHYFLKIIFVWEVKKDSLLKFQLNIVLNKHNKWLKFQEIIFNRFWETIRGPWYGELTVSYEQKKK